MITISEYDRIREHWCKHGEILLAQMGDFVEAFGKDAETVARVTGAILQNKRICGRRVNVAGFPLATAHDHIRELLAAGYTVYVAEPRDGTGVSEQARLATEGSTR